MKGTVLVTGADGFIGCRLTGALQSRGYDVRTHSLADGDISRCGLEYPGTGHVFHLAARSFVPESWTDPRGFYETNLLGTVNVLEFCRRKAASLTYVSSYVYGTPRLLPIPEEHPLEAVNPYGHSKILAEEACRFYAERHGLRVCIVRPFNIYGPGQEGRFLIPTLVRQALDPGRDVIEVADPRPRRDLLYVSDLIAQLIATAERGASGAYNAGSGTSAGIQEIVDILNGLVPRPKRLVSLGQARPLEILEVIADIRKAKGELLWKPEIGLTAGLRLTVEGMLNQTGAAAARSLTRL